MHHVTRLPFNAVRLWIVFGLLAAPALGEQSSRGATGAFIGVPLAPRLGAWGLMSEAGGTALPMHLSSLAGGETATGSILSPAFLINTKQIRMRLRGWDGPGPQGRAKNFAELVDAETSQTLRRAAPPFTTPEAREIAWDVQDLAGRRACLRLTDGDDAAAYAWFGIEAIDAGEAFKVASFSPRNLAGWRLEQAGNLSGRIRHLGGIPYLAGDLAFIPDNGSSQQFAVGLPARRLLFFGMTNSLDQGTPLWWYPTDYSMRYWIGDKLGEIEIQYQEGARETYPLILGDAVWWGDKFHQHPEPFATNPQKRQTLRECLRLHPAAPVPQGLRMAVIDTHGRTVASVRFIDESRKAGTVRILALTAEVPPGTPALADMTPMPAANPTSDTLQFMRTASLQPVGAHEQDRQARLRRLRDVLYTTVDNFPKSVALDRPEGYHGPAVRFDGNVHARILTNAYLHNLKEMEEKAGEDGMFHESTLFTASYGGYSGFGSYALHEAPYYNEFWTRNLSLKELCANGFLEKGKQTIEFSLRQARKWESPENAHLTHKGRRLPAHWGRVINKPMVGEHMGAFENDGHGLVMLLAYNVWRRLPEPEKGAWLKANWPDLRAAAEWILWQFEHPATSGATDVLMSDTEGVFMIGVGLKDHPGIYADYPCMAGLDAFAQMADSIGEKESARRWRERAARMRAAIEQRMTQGGQDGKPRVWSLWGAGWEHQSSLLAPLILKPDTAGLDPAADDPAWRRISAATYQRLLDKWSGKAAGKLDDEWWYLPHERPLATTSDQQVRPFGNYGISLGYGQGFVTQAALLLDRMQDAGAMLDWTARLIYSPDYKPWIVPEGSETHPDGAAWYRTGDLGNGFQQGSIMRALRYVIGVDDAKAERLLLIPRMPYDWTQLAVEQMPAWVRTAEGPLSRIMVDYTLVRAKAETMQLTLRFDQAPRRAAVRLGPFRRIVGNPQVTVNGAPFPGAAEQSGDSWWVRIELEKPERELRITAHPAAKTAR